MTIPRYLLEKHFAGDQRMILAMEEQSSTVSGTVAATDSLKDATVIVLSPNGDFTNERVLQVGEGIKIDVTADTVKLSVQNVALSQNYRVTFVPQSDVTLLLPVSGTLVRGESPKFDLNTIGNYASDAAAATGGVPLGGIYRNGSALQIRTV